MASLYGFSFNEMRIHRPNAETHMCGMCHVSQSQQSDSSPSASEYREKCNYLFRINGFQIGLSGFAYSTRIVYDKIKSARIPG